MEASAAATHACSKAHDGVAVNAGQALDGTDATALCEGGDDFNLLVAGKDVHGGPNPTWGTDPKRDAGKIVGNPLYC